MRAADGRLWTSAVASDIAGNLLDEDAQWRKLELVQEVARRVWG